MIRSQVRHDRSTGYQYDVRAKSGDYSYDALGRVTQIQYSDQTQTFIYDQGTNAKGRLTQVTDSSGNTQRGRLG